MSSKANTAAFANPPFFGTPCRRQATVKLCQIQDFTTNKFLFSAPFLAAMSSSRKLVSPSSLVYS